MSAEEKQKVPAGKELGEALGQGILVLVEGDLKYFEHTNEGMRRKLQLPLLTVLDPCGYCYLRGKVCDRPVGKDREDHPKCAWCAHTRSSCDTCDAFNDIEEARRHEEMTAALEVDNQNIIRMTEEVQAQIEKLEQEDEDAEEHE